MRLLASLLGLVLLAPAAAAWTAGPDRPHHADLAELAAQRLPAEWRELILSEREAFRKGALDPDGLIDPDADVHTFYHTYEPHQERGGGLYRVELSLHNATMNLRESRSAWDVAYQMGFLTHFATDLAVPFHTADGLYDHEQHEPFELGAYDHPAASPPQPTRPPTEVDDVGAYMTRVAERSAEQGDALVAALDASGGAWSPAVDRIARESEALAIEAAADMMYTAFARADPSRPEPTFDEQMPLPVEPEDAGLTLQEQWRKNPGIVLAAGGAVAAVALVGLLVLARRRAS